ncbi:ABC transporter related protein [Caldicellulosiruptor kronotskyensis 2002]|uniref:ABC transporter related protein n=1 Tax=Caldicellulosiruptor kronotskyensis (strain DSM 18902 / VKM B-2412 / 2002) TaxID=632348 RepID=E4SB48_CALK2|nr:ABC transporter ATP-binding protein [Caldicellulosiruptor kronotskyensis]ADQ45703.1 ABC transporter related protein [Caldicellulosiruptor kronotskyensis 2002]
MPLFVENLKCGYSYPIVEVDGRLKFEEGKVYGFVGPNGSGKSTLIKALAGLVKIFEGKIYFDNMQLSQLSDIERAKLISYMPQHVFSNFPFTVLDVVMMGRFPYEKSKFLNSKESRTIAEKKIKQVELSSKKFSSILRISGGERQRTSFARVLAQDTKVLLLDEPNSNLDISHQEKILRLVREEACSGKIVIMAIHNLKIAAKVCDSIIMMKDGRVVDIGRPDEVLTQENIRKVYEVDAVVYKNPFGIFDIELIQTDVPKTFHVHVVSGGGSAQLLYKMLIEMGCRVTTGVLSTNDTDFETAQLFSIYTVFTKPFMPIGEKEYIENIQLIKKADLCVLCNIPFGVQNLKNLEALKFANHLCIIEEEDISKRDFTGGLATKLYNCLREKALVFSSIESLKDYILKETNDKMSRGDLK